MVPVIDMKNFMAKGEERAAAMSMLAEASREWGFFQIVNHNIPHTLIDRVKEVCMHNFKIQTEKRSLNMNLREKILRDVISETVNDKVGTVDWEHSVRLQHLPTVLKQSSAWPAEPENYKEIMAEYVEQLRKLAEIVLDLFCENLQLEKGYLKRAFAGNEEAGAEPFYGTKIGLYPPCPRPDLVYGVRPHTDAGGIVLVLQDDHVGGLQVLKDDVWIDIQPIPYAILVDIGDQLEVMTNGKYRSMWHRVLTHPEKYRLSVATFYNPSLDAMVYPAPQLVEMMSEKDFMNSGYPKFKSSDYMEMYFPRKYSSKQKRFDDMKARESGAVQGVWAD